MKLLRQVETNPKVIKALTPIVKQDDVKKEIGRRIIDAIRERTQSGKDKDGERFKKYSVAYKKSAIFDIWGKSASQVNLVLTGDMQANMDVTKVTATGVELGFTSEKESEKAEGHIKGANHLPVRNFWGLPTEKQLDSIMRDVIKEYSSDRLLSQIDIIESGTKGNEVTFEG
jgi:hypothetical protein